MPKTLMFARLAAGDDLSDESRGSYLYSSEHDLSRLFTRIDVPDIGSDTASIPDVWAQPIRFQQALLKSDPAAVGQWRGLLALYILRGELHLEQSLELVPVFDQVASFEDTESGAREISFLRVARTLLPDELTKVSLGWSSIHLLLLNGRALGCTSPLTFLSPAATPPSDLAIPGCPWYATGVLSDPVASLVGDRLRALGQWLAEASNALKVALPRDAPALTETQGSRYSVLDALKSDILRKAVSSFAADVEKALRSETAPATSTITLSHRGQYRLKGIVQEQLNIVPDIKPVSGEDRLRQSSFLLQPADGAGAVQPILVIAQSFCNLPGFQSGRVEVYGGMTLNDALAVYSPKDHSVLGKYQLAPGKIFKADEIFTDSAFYIASPSAFPGAATYDGVDKMTAPGGGGMTPILPLRAEFAHHFTTEYLRRNVEFSGDHSKITVSLNIVLNGAGVSRGRAIRISKTYTGAAILTGLVPEVRIWPEYETGTLPGWKTWFTFYDDLKNLGNRLVVSPLPVGSGGKGVIATGIVDTTDRNKKITVHQGSVFPQKLYCSLEKVGEVGVLLPRGKERSESPTIELWKIGIDFGTTGSSVYYREGSPSSLRAPRPLQLEPHLLAVSRPSITETYGFFLPSEIENVDGILSVFRDFHPMGADLDIKPFHDGHISFIDRSEQGFLTGVNAAGICANMKWGNAAERARAKAFLKQLCLITALQARVAGAHEVEWVFSYPLSFSGDRANEFELTWNESRRFACLGSGYDVPSEAPRHFNESVCAALFARDRMQAGLRSGALVLDIGGGSSDISVWAGEGAIHNTSLLNASVKLGGRDIFQRPLLRGNPALLEALVAGEDREYVKRIAAENDESLGFSKIDSLFKRDSGNVEAMQRILTRLDNTRGEKDTVAFCKLLGLGLQGLFYYAGLLLRQKQAATADRKLLDGFLPDVYVCGNGSKIFAWLGFGQFSGAAERGLLNALAAGAGNRFTKRDTAGIHLSPQPKSEAAYGMLVAGGSETYEPQHIVSGESFRYKGTEYGTTDVVPYGVLDGEAFTVSPELPGLREAVQALELPALGHATERQVRERVNEKLAAIAGRRKSTAVMAHDRREEEQPIFIMELTELIGSATADWKEGKQPWW